MSGTETRRVMNIAVAKGVASPVTGHMVASWQALVSAAENGGMP